MGQLEPGAGKSVGKFFRIGKVSPRNRPINRVETQREIRRGHHRAALLGRVMSVCDHVFVFDVLGQPLIGAGRALDQFPLVFEQHFQIAHIPGRRIRFPCPFKTAGDRIAALAAFITASPAKTLRFKGSRFRFWSHMGRRTGAVALAEGMAAGNQRDGFFIVHSHARKGFAHVTAGGDRIGIAVRAFGVHIDQPHLHGRQRIFKIALARISALGLVAGRQPFLFAAPVDVFFRFPDVHAPAGKTEGFKSHRFQGAVAGQNHQVGPGDFFAVFLLDRPQKPSRLVEVHVIGPGI